MLSVDFSRAFSSEDFHSARFLQRGNPRFLSADLSNHLIGRIITMS